MIGRALKLNELAARLGCRLEGDGELEVARVTGLEQAGPGDVTFFANPRYAHALTVTRATAVILGETGPGAPCAMLRTANPYLAFADALELLTPASRPQPGIHPSAVLAPGVECGAGVSIGPLVVVGAGARIGAGTVVHPHAVIGEQASVGDDCTIHSHVAIRERVTIGHRVVIQNGAVIGGDGYGFAQRPDGSHRKVPQVGTVVIEDDVEIGANSTVDRPPVGETRVEAGTKIDNLVQVAHGVKVGRHALLAAQVGIAGSTTLEDGVVLGGQVGVAGHITIGRGVRATAQSGIANSVDAGAFVSGYPAIDNRDWLKASIAFKKLPELRKTVAALEARLSALEKQLAAAKDE